MNRLIKTLVASLTLLGMLAVEIPNCSAFQIMAPDYSMVVGDNYQPPAGEVFYNDGSHGYAECGCQQTDCATCNSGLRSGNRLRGNLGRRERCPNCECENCHLVAAPSETDKTCFQVEQKVVCIPKVRLPWQQACPPTTSRSRVVTVLKTHSYKCPSCSYTWTDKAPEPTAAGVATRPAGIPSTPPIVRQNSMGGPIARQADFARPPHWDFENTTPPIIQMQSPIVR